MNNHIKFGGRYRLQVHHGDTDILKYDTGWFSNIITDNGLNLLGTGGGGTLFVGSNGAAGAPGDTQITNPVSAGMSHLGYGNQYATAPYYGWSRYSAVFSIGAVVGTIAEIGTGSSATNLLSRSQLRNVGGSPITLTLGGIDRLTVYFELRQYFDLSDRTFNVSIDGVGTTCLCRPLIVNNGGFGSAQSMAATLSLATRMMGCTFYYNGTAPYIGANMTTVPSGTAIGGSYLADEPYVPGSYKNVQKLGLTAAQGIVNNITAMTVVSGFTWTGAFGWHHGQFGGGFWQLSFNPPISKTQYEDLRLTFETTWARA